MKNYTFLNSRLSEEIRAITHKMIIACNNEFQALYSAECLQNARPFSHQTLQCKIE